MWPPLLLLLGLDLGLRSLSLPLASRSAGAIVSAPVSPAGTVAHGSPPEARPRDPPRGKAVALRSAGGARGLSWLSGRTRLSLRPRVALGRGVILSGGRGICLSHRSSRWAQRPCLHVHVLLRAPRARRATPTHVDLHVPARRGRLSLQRLAPLQRSLGSPEWTFHLGSVSPTDASSASGLSPRSTPPGGRLPSRGFVAQTECPTDGLRPVVSEGVTSDNPPAVGSSVSCPVARQELCVIKNVSIDEDVPGVSLVFAKNMDICIMAHIIYDCPSAQSKVVDWDVFSVPWIWSRPDWYSPLPVVKSVSRQGMAMEIPKNTLPYGVYVVRVSLKLVRPTGDEISNSDFTYFTIARTPLQAVLVGASNIRVPFTQEVVLDGSASGDPEADDPLEGLQFSWYCTMNPGDYQGAQIDMRSQAVCLPEHGSLRWPGASSTVLRLPPQTLKGSRVYFFRMVIHKGDATAFSNKRVQVLPGPAPRAHIVCMENCDPVLVISDRFSLFFNCTNCVEGRELYRNFKEAQFQPSILLQGWGGHIVLFVYSITINRAPETGDCKMAHEAEHQPLGVFECQLCSLTAPYSYVGQKPPNTQSIILLEESFVTKDPFTPDKDRFLVLGSRCSVCSRLVCVGPECSLFYSKRFCLPCVQENVHAFPQEIRHDLEKRKVPSKRPASQPSTQA
ncbi:hypothetical protein HJG60_010023 [Phyllostomus discolor]|uniref:Cysteine-rich DPF motif domain-containing protein 1 n=2 Tax=Phyllostomus discolor TaxID=89673 RepID=A0A834EJI2_9CHIR|nr:hypothetical protein HJG60_010023 [Phyllostomus discolor]